VRGINSCSGRTRRRRVLSLALCTFVSLVGIGLIGALQLSHAPRAGAANCRVRKSCPRPAPGLPAPTITTSRRNSLPPTTRASDRAIPITAPPVTVPAIPAVETRTGCTAVVGGVVWPPRWRVRCDGARLGLLGTTDRTRGTTLFVRTGEGVARLRVVALHEAGHAWDIARLDARRIARWCAARGCAPRRFFSDPTAKMQPRGAEDWAASWDACHGGEYHRSYLGLAAPSPAQCALQDVLVGFPT